MALKREDNQRASVFLTSDPLQVFLYLLFYIISGLKHHRGNQDKSLSFITTTIIIIKKESQSISIALIELMNHMNA